MLYIGPQRYSASFFVISQSSSLYCHPSRVQDQVSMTFISSSHMHSCTHTCTNAHLHKSKQRVFPIKQYSKWNISLKETSVKNLAKTCTPQFILPNRIFFFSLEKHSFLVTVNWFQHIHRHSGKCFSVRDSGNRINEFHWTHPKQNCREILKTWDIKSISSTKRFHNTFATVIMNRDFHDPWWRAVQQIYDSWRLKRSNCPKFF